MKREILDLVQIMQITNSWISGLFFRSEYTERCVMNNYFGIGLDAKITLDFQNKRDEHPEKCRYVNFNMKVKIFRSFSDFTSRFIVDLFIYCKHSIYFRTRTKNLMWNGYLLLIYKILIYIRSRTKNFMWYGVLGGKELVQRSFKNLDQRVQLECDGQRIPLPSLQGIVILNIPRYINLTHLYSTYHLAKFI